MDPIRSLEQEFNNKYSTQVFHDFLEQLAEQVGATEELEMYAGMTDEELRALLDESDSPEEAVQTAAEKIRVRRHNKHVRRIAIGTVVLCLIMAAVAYGGSKLMTMYPYAITSNDEVVCYVPDKITANKAVQKAITDLVGEEADVKLVDTGDTLKVKLAETKDIAEEEIKTADEAAESIVDAATDKDADLEIKVASIQTETRTFTPEPEYIQDYSRLAGTTIIEDEGQDGVKEVTMSVVTTNGKVSDSEDLVVNVVEEGRPAVIVKGVLGMPTDADWKTYDGNPVYNDGAALVTTARSYVGKVQYVKGGTSLTSGVDCVGFVRAIYRLYGINLSSHLGSEGFKVSYKDAMPGDILIFAHHVAIYIGDGKMVHAANPKMDVCVSPVSAGTHLKQVRRIVKRG